MSDFVCNWNLGLDISDFFNNTEKEPTNQCTNTLSSESKTNTTDTDRPTTVLPKVLDSVQKFIDCQKKDNTVNATKQHLKTLTNWLIKFKNESRPIHEIQPEQLNLYLQEFFISVKKLDGSEYELASLDAMKSAIDRHIL